MRLLPKLLSRLIEANELARRAAMAALAMAYARFREIVREARLKN